MNAESMTEIASVIDGVPGLGLRRQWAVAPERPAPELTERLGLGPETGSGPGVFLFAHPETLIARGRAGALELVVLGVASRASGAGLFEGLAGEGDVAGWLRDLVGVYAVIACGAGGARVYTDPGGMMNVFIGAGGAVASTPAALPETSPGQHAAIGRDDWWLWDSAPFEGVRVLPANHALDLETGRFERFWPAGPIESIDTDEAVARGAEILRSSMASLVRERAALVSLTGGLDSRVSLAAASGLDQERVRAFTLDVLGPRERALVEELVRISGVGHEWVRVPAAPADVLELYDGMTLGMSVGARREVSGGCWSLRGTEAVHVSGNLGAIAKAFYWPGGSAERPTPGTLLRDFHDRGGARRRGAEAWAASVPAGLSAEAACNLAYLEQRGGRWMGIGETASNLFYAPTSLFSSRALFEIISGAPASMQRDGRLLRAFVERLSPELAAVGYASGTAAWRRMMPRRLKSLLAPVFKRGVSGGGS